MALLYNACAPHLGTHRSCARPSAALLKTALELTQHPDVMLAETAMLAVCQAVLYPPCAAQLGALELAPFFESLFCSDESVLLKQNCRRALRKHAASALQALPGLVPGALDERSAALLEPFLKGGLPALDAQRRNRRGGGRAGAGSGRGSGRGRGRESAGRGGRVGAANGIGGDEPEQQLDEAARASSSAQPSAGDAGAGARAHPAFGMEPGRRALDAQLSAMGSAGADPSLLGYGSALRPFLGADPGGSAVGLGCGFREEQSDDPFFGGGAFEPDGAWGMHAPRDEWAVQNGWVGSGDALLAAGPGALGLDLNPFA
jgi:hypothetical protein